jgi:hypothetical protein
LVQRLVHLLLVLHLLRQELAFLEVLLYQLMLQYLLLNLLDLHQRPLVLRLNQ